MNATAVILFGILGLATSCCAQGEVIDQRNDQSNRSSLTRWTLQVGDPVGQEFVPTLGGVDFVETVFFDHDFSQNPITIQVLIHDGTIVGPVVGASSPVTFIASDFGSIRRFDFPSTAPVIPGQIYVMELFQSGPQNDSIGADPSAAYLTGQMIRSGAPFDGYDLWFREGMVVVVPEPSLLTLSIAGVAVFATAFRRRREIR